MYDFAKNKISLAIIAFLKFCFLAVSELSYKQDLQHGYDKGWMREQVCAQLPELWLCATATRARWFFGHPSLLDTPEVKSVPEPADSE
jgi:hypothetical protein